MLLSLISLYVSGKENLVMDVTAFSDIVWNRPPVQCDVHVVESLFFPPDVDHAWVCRLRVQVVLQAEFLYSDKRHVSEAL